MDANLDLFDYISNMNVGGEEAKQKENPNEETKEVPKSEPDPFNFDSFAV